MEAQLIKLMRIAYMVLFINGAFKGIPLEVLGTEPAGEHQYWNHIYLSEGGKDHAITNAEELIRDAEVEVVARDQKGLQQAGHSAEQPAN